MLEVFFTPTTLPSQMSLPNWSLRYFVKLLCLESWCETWYLETPLKKKLNSKSSCSSSFVFATLLDKSFHSLKAPRLETNQSIIILNHWWCSCIAKAISGIIAFCTLTIESKYSHNTSGQPSGLLTVRKILGYDITKKSFSKIGDAGVLLLADQKSNAIPEAWYCSREA